jgi:hypothetical protein
LDNNKQTCLTSKMTACGCCHAAKVKCDLDEKNGGTACSRCERLGKSCVPHISLQGKGKKRRLGEIKTAPFATALLAKAFSSNPTEHGIKPDHFGMLWLIRKWVAIAAHRRSFSLWVKAGQLALTCGITMDSVFCGGEVSSTATEGQDSATQNSKIEAIPKMDFLSELLLTPHKLQHKNASRIKWCEIPNVLLASSGCPLGVGCGRDTKVEPNGGPQNVTSSFSEQDNQQEDLSHLGNRWVIIREYRGGHSRHFVSPAFERDIVSWAVIQDTWDENKCE